MLCEDVQAIHLPHTRDTEANRETARVNYGQLLRKWTEIDVELAHRFGDVEANAYYRDLMSRMRSACGGSKRSLGGLHLQANGMDVVVIGAVFDETGRTDSWQSLFPNATVVSTLPWQAWRFA